jgi:hypothetical protein
LMVVAHAATIINLCVATVMSPVKQLGDLY